jgi:hypothetical protein
MALAGREDEKLVPEWRREDGGRQGSRKKEEKKAHEAGIGSGWVVWG